MTDYTVRPTTQSSTVSRSLSQSHRGSSKLDIPQTESTRRSSSAMEHYSDVEVLRSASRAGDPNVTPGVTLSRSGTLRKRNSMHNNNTMSLRRRNSGRSSVQVSAGAVGAKGVDMDRGAFNSVFYTPVPTTGSPTDRLVDRFSAWRRYLKDLVAYYHEIQISYEHQSKSMLKVSNVINNITVPPNTFMLDNGILEGPKILRDHHKQAIAAANKAREIEEEIVAKLNNLRHDLGQKIKEIKSLSGDFKNTVDKEKEHTRRAVEALDQAIATYDSNPALITGKNDPYVLRLQVERQIEKQLDEENYLHRAYLNLEGSGRELESIVVGEMQKSYNAYAGILRREAEEAIATAERLRDGPVSMAKDLEWSYFVENEPDLVNPSVQIRRTDSIEYPGKYHPAAAEVRAGMLERKSKYLKSYTPGWYVLTTTHLHEFKSADRIHTQAPVISLALPEQKLGSHSQLGSSSNKFILKGRQTGGIHRGGHSWVFRAESYDTMLAWYDDIKTLTEQSGEEKRAFMRRHARSLSAGSNRHSHNSYMGGRAGGVGGTGGAEGAIRGGGAPSVSSDGMDEDEADRVPYAAGEAALDGRVLGTARTMAGAQVVEMAGSPTQNAQRSAGGGAVGVGAVGVGAVGTGAVTGGNNAAGAGAGTRSAAPASKDQDQTTPKRPSPGGRFPSDVHVNRDLRASRLSSSASSSEPGEVKSPVSPDAAAAATGESAAVNGRTVP